MFEAWLVPSNMPQLSDHQGRQKVPNRAKDKEKKKKESEKHKNDILERKQTPENCIMEESTSITAFPGTGPVSDM